MSNSTQVSTSATTVNEDVPFSVRLGKLKKPLINEAAENERSLHWLILKILRNHLRQKGTIDGKSER